MPISIYRYTEFQLILFM